MGVGWHVLTTYDMAADEIAITYVDDGESRLLGPNELRQTLP
jgi:hypothetical protein